MNATPKHLAFINNLNAFLHAHIDDEVALVSAKRKRDGEPVVIACIRREVEVPSRVIGAPPAVGEQLIPVFEFVDHTRENPYVPDDPSAEEIPPPSAVLLTDPHAAARQAFEHERAEPANAA